MYLIDACAPSLCHGLKKPIQTSNPLKCSEQNLNQLKLTWIAPGTAGPLFFNVHYHIQSIDVGSQTLIDSGIENGDGAYSSRRDLHP